MISYQVFLFVQIPGLLKKKKKVEMHLISFISFALIEIVHNTVEMKHYSGAQTSGKTNTHVPRKIALYSQPSAYPRSI